MTLMDDCTRWVKVTNGACAQYVQHVGSTRGGRESLFWMKKTHTSSIKNSGRSNAKLNG